MLFLTNIWRILHILHIKTILLVLLSMVINRLVFLLPCRILQPLLLHQSYTKHLYKPLFTTLYRNPNLQVWGYFPDSLRVPVTTQVQNLQSQVTSGFAFSTSPGFDFPGTINNPILVSSPEEINYLQIPNLLWFFQHA